MTVIVFKNTEKIPHLLKTERELAKNHHEIGEWRFIFWSRCPRCDNIFVSTTERKYCSKKCQYNQKEKEPDWAITEPLGPLKYFCEKCGKEITSKSDNFQKLNKEKDYSYYCKKCYYEKEGNVKKIEIELIQHTNNEWYKDNIWSLRTNPASYLNESDFYKKKSTHNTGINLDEFLSDQTHCLFNGECQQLEIIIKHKREEI